MRDYLGLLLNILNELFPEDVYFFMTKEEALRELRGFSGKDFGDDVEAWEHWVDEYKRTWNEKYDREHGLASCPDESQVVEGRRR